LAHNEGQGPQIPLEFNALKHYQLNARLARKTATIREMNKRRTFIAGTLALIKGAVFGQRSGSPVATGPVPFGYKMAWMAVRCETLDVLVSYLDLKERRQVSWDEGTKFVYDDKNKGLVFLTPPVKEWIFVVGWSAAALADAEPVKSFYNTIKPMSARFGEVQAFATHRVIEYQLWMQAANGHIVRSFAYAGEKGELLDNFGPLTAAEKSLRFWNEPPEHWNPDEEDVMKVAAGWSMDPSKLTVNSGPVEFGVIGRVGIRFE